MNLSIYLVANIVLKFNHTQIMTDVCSQLIHTPGNLFATILLMKYFLPNLMVLPNERLAVTCTYR